MTGTKIVLTSDEVTMSDFGNDAFMAFMCTFPIGFMGKFIQKKIGVEMLPDGRPKIASYGLRKVEALLQEELGEDSVVVAHPKMLHKFVGDDTKIIGVSCHDPMGMAYVSTTYNSIIHAGGDAINYHYFRKLMNHPSIRGRDKKNTRLIAGGPGVWQIKDTDMQDEFGIDTLLYGDAEIDLPEIFQRVLNGEEIGREVKMHAVDPETMDIPLIRNPASFGCVEITRGCGRNCQFCYPTMRKRYSFPISYIMKEVEVNVKGGGKSIFLVTDDVFLYDTHPNFVPNRESMVKLISSIANYPGVEEIHLSHAAMAPVVKDPKMIEEISPYLIDKSKRKWRGRTYVTAEIGVETGSVRILKKSMRGKALPFLIDDWHDIVDTGLGILNDNHWYPLCTFMTGTPDETEDDVLATLELIDRIKDRTLLYVPVIFIPIEGTRWGKEARKGLDHLSDLQWEIITTGWKRNVSTWSPELKNAIRVVGLPLYWMYLRWVHGSKTVGPVMRFFGFPDRMFKQRAPKQCDPMYCGSAAKETPAEQPSIEANGGGGESGKTL
jgi:radical SAM superfamily enzyme YgiQ (UPF0313 family)